MQTSLDMSAKINHGGPRKGAGRKAGGKNKAPAKGRKAVTRSVSMLGESWEKLDSQRGKLSRGKYIDGLIS